MHQGLTEKLGDDLRCRVSDRILDRSLQVYEYLTTLFGRLLRWKRSCHRGESLFAASLDTSEPEMFMAIPRSARFQSWGVIDTITSPTTLG